MSKTLEQLTNETVEKLNTIMEDLKDDRTSVVEEGKATADKIAEVSGLREEIKFLIDGKEVIGYKTPKSAVEETSREVITRLNDQFGVNFNPTMMASIADLVRGEVLEAVYEWIIKYDLSNVNHYHGRDVVDTEPDFLVIMAIDTGLRNRVLPPLPKIADLQKDELTFIVAYNPSPEFLDKYPISEGYTADHWKYLHAALNVNGPYSIEITTQYPAPRFTGNMWAIIASAESPDIPYYQPFDYHALRDLTADDGIWTMVAQANRTDMRHQLTISKDGIKLVQPEIVNVFSKETLRDLDFDDMIDNLDQNGYTEFMRLFEEE